MKKNIVIASLLIIIILMGGTSYYLYTNKDNINKCNTKCPHVSSKEETSNNKNVDNLRTGKYIAKQSINNGQLYINVEVEILNDKEMTIKSDDGQAQLETSKGTYTVNDRILTYEREYDYIDEQWKKCEWSEDNVGCSTGVKKEEYFIIEKDSLAVTNYLSNKYNLVLEYSK